MFHRCVLLRVSMGMTTYLRVFNLRRQPPEGNVVQR